MRHEMKLLPKIIIFLLPTKLRAWLSSNIFPEESNLLISVFRNKTEPGVMFDVGAGHGSTFIPFAKIGWKVFAFEPDSINYQEASINKREFSNVELLNFAIAGNNKKNVKFYRSDTSDGISGLSSFDPTHLEFGSVETIRLDTFCELNEISEINYLKVDAEGYDFEVIKSLDWVKIKPDFIMFEFEDGRSEALGYKLTDVIEFLKHQKCGYNFVISEWHPVTKRGRPHKWRQFTTNPFKVAKNGWGNVIAVKNQDDYKRLLEITTQPLIKIKWKVGQYFMKFWWGIRFGF